MSDKNLTKHTIKLYLNHALKYKVFLFPLIISMLFTILVRDYGQPYIQSLILQKISDGNYDVNNLWQSFNVELVAYVIAVLSTDIASWRLNIWLVWNLEMRVMRDIAIRVFKHLINLDSDFHANSFGGSLVSQTNKLVGSYIRFADSIIFNLFTLTVGLIATLLILGPRVPLFAFSLVVLSIIFIIGNVYLSKPVRAANIKQANQESKQTGQLADSIANIMAIKSFAKEDFESKRYYREATKTKDATHQSMVKTMYRETFSSSITSLITISALIIAVVGTRYFGADIATLFLIVTYTTQIGIRLWDFQHVLRQVNRSLGDASDMVRILQIEPKIADPQNPEKTAINRGLIEFKDVDFTHSENNEPLFQSLNLRIKPGEKIGLVGHSGSGKTSLTKLLLRFSDIDGGEIRIDGQDIRNISQKELRSHITYVPQEPLLFHRSLSENIAYARPNASSQEIEGIAKLAHAHEFIDKLPDKYNTLVGERGVKLSGGQKQRVAIARSLLKNSPILVLDEATSALDSESEILIQESLWKLMENKTAIVIAHRLSTIQKMDRIIVLHEGKIIEEGTHKELLKNNKGQYAKLWSHQTGGYITE